MCALSSYMKYKEKKIRGRGHFRSTSCWNMTIRYVFGRFYSSSSCRRYNLPWAHSCLLQAQSESAVSGNGLMEVGPTRSRILTPHKSSNTNKPKCVPTRIDLDFTCFNHSLICQQIYRGMIYLLYNPLILRVQFNNFSKFIEFCNHCYNLILEYLYHINNIPHAH